MKNAIAEKNLSLGADGGNRGCCFRAGCRFLFFERGIMAGLLGGITMAMSLIPEEFQLFSVFFNHGRLADVKTKRAGAGNGNGGNSWFSHGNLR